VFIHIVQKRTTSFFLSLARFRVQALSSWTHYVHLFFKGTFSKDKYISWRTKNYFLCVC
jgi:hypothetical protein